MAAVASNLDFSKSRQPQLYASILVTYCLAVLAVALRFISRRLKKAGLGLDDWLMFTALIIDTGLLVDLLIWIHHGYGKHFQLLNPDTYVMYFFQGLFAGEILYTGVLCFVKYSILALYWRLFSRASIRLPIWILATIVTCWSIAVIVTTCLQCSPIQGYWDRAIGPTCGVNQQKFLLGLSIPNILTDIVLLTLPIPYILWLHADRSQKIVLCSMFLLGSFVCIASILRLVSVITVDLTSPDLTWNFAWVGVWTLVETNVAIISACLPSLRPIYSLVTTGSASHSSQTHSAKRSRDPFSSFRGLKTPTNLSSKSGQNTTSRSIDTDSTHPFTALDDNNHRGQQDSSTPWALVGKEVGQHSRAETIQLKKMSPSTGRIQVDSEIHIDVV